MSKMVVIAALGAIVAMGMNNYTNADTKNTSPKKLMKGLEKCYGVAKAGKNDCGSVTATCAAGQSKTDGDKKAWISVPKGTCDKIIGGSTTPPKT